MKNTEGVCYIGYELKDSHARPSWRNQGYLARALPPSPITRSCGHWLLHIMSITPNILMLCIDIQGEEHNCQSNDFWEFLPRQKSPANRNAHSNGTRERYATDCIPDSCYTDALIGRFPIGALYSPKLGVIAEGFVWERALRIADLQEGSLCDDRVESRNLLVWPDTYQTQYLALLGRWGIRS
jgi:hypothetical protein